MRLKIPKVTDEAIISAFSDGVCDIKMKEELAVHEELWMTLELFNIATKCARAEEGRVSLLEIPVVDPDSGKYHVIYFHMLALHNECLKVQLSLGGFGNS